MDVARPQWQRSEIVEQPFASLPRSHHVNEVPTTTSFFWGGGERSGSVVECLTQDRRAVGSSLTGVTALWSLSKTHLS